MKHSPQGYFTLNNSQLNLMIAVCLLFLVALACGGSSKPAGENAPRSANGEIAVEALMDGSFAAPAYTATHTSGALPNFWRHVDATVGN
jgi:hypothetical protein